MSDLLVIVPSRGRPANITGLADTWQETTSGHASLLVVLDDDDPTWRDYPSHPRVLYAVGPRERLVPTLNREARQAILCWRAVGFVGDDHRPRTVGWDKQVCAELDRLGTGIVYGNDLLQGERLPTAVFMTSDIVETLGWMAPPGLIHLFADDAWKTLGEAVGCLSYLPDVIIEHMHPVAGKADWDDGYRECNSAPTYDADQRAFTDWRDTRLPQDAAKIRALR